MQGLNPKIINMLAKQQAELVNKMPDGKSFGFDKIIIWRCGNSKISSFAIRLMI